MKKKRFIEISSFLKEFECFHELEMLRLYPGSYPLEMDSWIDEIEEWSFKEFAELESHPHEDKVNHSTFKAYLKCIRKLSNIKKIIIKESDLPNSLLRNVNEKKKHEISVLKTITEPMDINSIVDLGGGIGLLSSSLILNCDRHAFCVDRDELLQIKGTQRIERWRKQDQDKITFVNQDFNQSSKLPDSINPKESMVVSLHGCGDLSTSALLFANKNKYNHFLNLGCCYHKINKAYNLSGETIESHISFSQNALHLASRSAAIVDASDIEMRFQFKRFRYTYHYYFHDKYSLAFTSIGNATKKDYNGKFSDYLLKYCPDQYKQNIEISEVEQYYNSEGVIKKVKRNYAADTIRFLLGRLIELYIVLDRAIYLEEMGYETEVAQIFERNLSPRNIMLKATKLAP